MILCCTSPMTTTCDHDTAYALLDRVCRHKGTGQPMARRKIDNNTYGVRHPDSIAVVLHSTEVVVAYADGRIRLDTGGWLTVTTGDRIRKFTPPGVDVFALRGRWYLSVRLGESSKTVAFYDGVTFDPSDLDSLLPSPMQESDDAHNAEVDALLDRYLRGLTPARVAAAMASIAGDCWYCSMHEVGTGRTMGDIAATGKSDHHLMEHLRERYYMGSLIVNAYRDRRYGNVDVVLSMVYREVQAGRMPGDLKRNLRRYFRNRLYVGNASGPQGKRVMP